MPLGHRYAHCTLSVRTTDSAFWQHLRTFVALCVLSELFLGATEALALYHALGEFDSWCEHTTIESNSLCYAIIASWTCKALIAVSCAIGALFPRASSSASQPPSSWL